MIECKCRDYLHFISKVVKINVFLHEAEGYLLLSSNLQTIATQHNTQTAVALHNNLG